MSSTGGNRKPKPMDFIAVQEFNCLGLAGPVFIVADATSIGQQATGWATALKAVDLVHRVRLCGGSSPGEIAAVVAEARSFEARTIVAAGGAGVHETARAIAATIMVPLVAWPTAPVGRPAH